MARAKGSVKATVRISIRARVRMEISHTVPDLRIS